MQAMGQITLHMGNSEWFLMWFGDTTHRENFVRS